MRIRPIFVTLIIIVVAGCRSTPTETIDDVVVPADAGDPDSSTAPLEPGEYSLAFETDQRTRTYQLYVPSSYDHSSPTPLVFLFHGGGGDAERLEAFGFNELADRDGWLVVYPQGVENNWADGRGTTDAALAGADDVAFVSGLIDSISAQLNVDPDRVFATGASNGGIFSHRLGCDLADRIRAIGPVIGALATNHRPNCNPASPVSVISIRGTDDPFIPIDGGDSAHERFENLGDGGLVESAEASRLFWAEANNCQSVAEEDLAPDHPDDPTRVKLFSHSDCDEGTAVQYYIVEGMGHTWPPFEGIAPRISGVSSSQLSATSLIWSFFASR